MVVLRTLIRLIGQIILSIRPIRFTNPAYLFITSQGCLGMRLELWKMLPFLSHAHLGAPSKLSYSGENTTEQNKHTIFLNLCPLTTVTHYRHLPNFEIAPKPVCCGEISPASTTVECSSASSQSRRHPIRVVAYPAGSTEREGGSHMLGLLLLTVSPHKDGLGWLSQQLFPCICRHGRQCLLRRCLSFEGDWTGLTGYCCAFFKFHSPYQMSLSQ